MALVNLVLDFNDTAPPSVIPTTSQVLSLLASNPGIRCFELQWLWVSDDGGNDSMSPVPLHHLERLSLEGSFHHVFPILRQLELPKRIDNVTLNFSHCGLAEVRETVRSFIRDHLRRDSRFEDRLGVSTSSSAKWFTLQACTIGVGPGLLPQNPPHVEFEMQLAESLSLEVHKGLFIDTLTHLPREGVVYLKTNLMVAEMVDILIKMPNIEHLYFFDMIIRKGFLLQGSGETNTHQNLLPSLKRLYLENVQTEDEDWGPLITYLTHKASDNQAISLEVFGNRVHICSDVLDQIYGLAKEMVYRPDPTIRCPFHRC